MMDVETIYKEVKQLRARLHDCPELAMEEKETKRILLEFLSRTSNLIIEDRGPYFFCRKEPSSQQKGTNGLAPIAFRADFDAVEGKDGKAGHYCGHDGHAAILAGLALMLDQMEVERDVYLLFQPGEETGQGGPLVAPVLQEKKIGEVYGCHNIPGYPGGAILLRDQTFACASVGIELCFKGSPSHAAYPENGVNPGDGIGKLLAFVSKRIKEASQGMILATMIGIEAGSKAYGLSASEARIRYTIRGEKDVEFQALLADILQAGEKIAIEEKLNFSYEMADPFPATENHPPASASIRQVAQRAGLETIELAAPFRWSEDFGHYLKHCQGAMFGVGAGVDHPGLHTEGYGFNDEIIPAVLAVYRGLIRLKG